jgi:hypothetical protein
MALRDLALARLAKLNGCPNGTVPKACPNGTVPRGCPSGTADQPVGTLGTVGTAGTLGTAGTAGKTTLRAFPHPVRLGNADASPKAWVAGLARLDPACPPRDVPLRRWTRFIQDSREFIDQGWAAQAVGLGWTALDLFGCHRQAPFARIAQQGLLWLLNGRRLVALTTEFAAIETASGGRLTYRRAPIETGQVLAWKLGQVREAAHE